MSRWQFSHIRRYRKKLQLLNANNLPAVGDGAEQSKTKHEARRAQIRSAQIRHRQRKAHYQKELECDVNKYRTLINHAEAETSLLRRENDAIRAALLAAGVALPEPRQQLTAEEQASFGLQSMQIDPYTSPSTGLESRSAQSGTPELFSNIDINDLTVTLQVDEIMGTPAFNISSNSSSASYYSVPSPSQSGDGEVVLSRVQEQAAINFILAYVLRAVLFGVYNFANVFLLQSRTCLLGPLQLR